MRIHFIAIGGSSMHNLALELQAQGHQITGSDDAFYEPSKSRLLAKNILPSAVGWFPEKISKDIDAIILGMHAKKDNPELLKAQERGIKIYSYPEFLYLHGENKTRVVIAGSHGKTTITSMVLHVFNYHNREVDYMVGAQLIGFDRMIHLTKDNDFFVLEGDEYLSSPIDLQPKILWYKPNIALISGIAWDHINVFETEEKYIQQFEKFIETIVHGGILIYNENDPKVVALIEKAKTGIKKIAYSTPKYEIIDTKTYIYTHLGKIPLNIFGSHNLNNLMGAKWVCQTMGIYEEDFYEAITSFEGAANRLEKIKEDANLTIFKDFAHAPSKVKASIKAVKEQFSDRKILAVIELHTYSSLNHQFVNQYKDLTKNIDSTIVFMDKKNLEIKGKQVLSPELIGKAFKNPNIRIITNTHKLKEALNEFKKIQEEKKVILFMSSGSFGDLDLSNI